MSTEETTRPTGWNGYRFLSIDDIAAMQPGLARLMPVIAERYWKLYYAAKAGDWVHAKFQVGEIRELMEFGSVTRPKYEENLEKFINDNLGAIEAALKNKDLAAFEEAYHQGIKDANDFHKVYEKPITWKLPPSPPSDMEFTPRDIGSWP